MNATSTTTTASTATFTNTTTLPAWYRTCEFNETTVESDHSIGSVHLALKINGASFLLLFSAFVVVFFAKPFARALAPLGGECKSLWDWMRPLWHVRYQDNWRSVEDDQEREMLEHPPGVPDGVCLDGQMLIRFCMLGFKFCLFGSLVSAFLLPLYANSYNGSREDNFMQYTASSVVGVDKSAWLVWFVVLAGYTLTAAFCWLARAEWKTFLMLRREHFLRCSMGQSDYSGAAQALHSVLVEQVPPQMQSQDALKTAFHRLIPSASECVLLEDTRHIHHRIAVLKTTSCWSWCSAARCCGPSIQKVERAYAHRVSQVMQIERDLRHNVRRAHEILEYGRRALDDTVASSTAVVTFHSLADRLVAEQVSLFGGLGARPGDWRVFPAPEARDIIWKNAASPLSHVRLRVCLCSLLCVLGVLFWSAPVLALQAATRPRNLEDYAPLLAEWVEESQSQLVRNAYSFLTGYLPVLTTFALWLVPPSVLELISLSFERRKTKSEIAQAVMMRNFSFQLASLYLLAIGGFIWESVRDIASNPFCASQLLGATVPKVAVYFMTFVIARTGITLPMLLLRVYALWHGFRRMIGADPEEQQDEPCWWGYEGTNVAIVLVLANMYSVIAPWIMPICTLYFMVAAAAYRWLFKNVYVQEFDGAGQCWFGLFNAAMVGLLGGSLALTGIVALNGVLTPEFFATWLLPVLIVWFQYRCNTVYGPLARRMSLEMAKAVDAAAGPGVVEKFEPELYKDPIQEAIMNLSSGYLSNVSSTSDSSDSCSSSGDDMEERKSSNGASRAGSPRDGRSTARHLSVSQDG